MRRALCCWVPVEVYEHSPHGPCTQNLLVCASSAPGKNKTSKRVWHKKQTRKQDLKTNKSQKR